MTKPEVPVVAIVTFPVAGGLDDASVLELLEESGPKYLNIPGLRRKYFLSGDGVAGGVYEWSSRSRAEAFYSESWYATTKKQSGAVPQVVIYESLAIADGISHQLKIYGAH